MSLPTRSRARRPSWTSPPAEGGTADEVSRREDLADVQTWDTRIFRERERSLRYVCELPTLLEQRAFTLGREIAAALKK